MKHQSKHNTAKLSSNQRIGNWLEDKHNERQQAIENSKLFDILQHLKDKPITYLLKR